MTQLWGTDRASCFTPKKVAFRKEETYPERPFGGVLKKS